MSSSRSRTPEAQLFLLLRVGVAFCFIGHGAFGILRKEAWLPYFQLFGIGPDLAHWVMPLVGTVDIAVGVLALAWPARVVFLYAAGWGLMTAALRPLAGEGVWELLERAGNYGVPVAALLLAAGESGAGRWLSPLRAAIWDERGARKVLLAARWTTGGLLIGHGALALQGKPLLLEHAAAIGAGPWLVHLTGAAEVLAGAAVLLLGSVPLFLAVAGWKIASEALFLTAGAPVWEWVERGGSYVAPLAAAWLLVSLRGARAPVAGRALAPAGPAPAPPGVASATGPARGPARRAGAGSAGFAAAVTLLAAGALVQPLAAQELPPRVDDSVLERLRSGGLILACRHAATDPNAPPAADRLATRPLTPEGERQAERMGELLRALGIPLADVRTSPYARTRRTAELAFGEAVLEDALWTSGKREEVRPRLFADPPEDGNRVLMTHQGILYRILPVPRRSIQEGDCLVLEGRGSEGFRILGQASNADWERLRDGEGRRSR